MGKHNHLLLPHLLGLLFSFFALGFIGPLITYLTADDKASKEHSKRALNWHLSALIYGIICILLMILLIGFVLIAVLGILNLVFCIIAMVKASNGELWDYPMAIGFFK